MWKNEHAFTRWWSGLLTRCNCCVIPMVGGLMQTDGLPDRYVIGQRLPGVWVESKGLHTRVRKMQRVWIERFLERGVPALIWRPASSTVLRFQIPTGKEAYTTIYEEAINPRTITPVGAREMLITAVAAIPRRRPNV